TSQPKRVTSIRKLVNGTVKEVGSEDEITSYEYKKPESPTCHPEADLAETVVSYKPGEATATYCFDANDHFTGPPSEAEEEEAGSGTPEETPAGTCYEAEVFSDCSLEEEPPENVEDLPAAGYGLADNNWILPNTVGKYHLDYFTENQPFKELEVSKMRRTMPWNMAFEARKDDEKPGFDPGAKAQRADVEAWIKEVKALHGNTGEPMISFDMCPAGSHSENPEEVPDPNEGTEEDKKEEAACATTPPTWQQYQIAMKYFFERPVLAEVQSFSAWNEPNRHDEPTAKHAHTAGQYWRVLSDMCINRHKEETEPKKPECHVAAGEFLDSEMGNAYNGAGSSYFKEYLKGAGRVKSLNRWAWHAYSDGISTQEPSQHTNRTKWWGRLKHFREAINLDMKNSGCTPCRNPAIWLSEQGVQYFADSKRKAVKLTRGATGKGVFIWGHRTLAEGIMNAYVKAPGKQATTQPHVTRFYYYQLVGSPRTPTLKCFDSGLLEAHETLPELLTRPRPALAPREIFRIYRTKTQKGG